MKISRGHFTLRGALCLAAAVSVLSALSVVALPTATAAENLPGTHIGYPNTFFAYVGAGENLDVRFEKTATSGLPGEVDITVEGPGVAPASCHLGQVDPAGTACEWTDLTGAPGIWRISFATTAGTEQVHYPGILFASGAFQWDIDVQLGIADIPGRVWSDQYTMAQALPTQVGGQFFDLTYWFQSAFGVQYQVDYHEYNGIHSVFLADPVGIRENGTCNSVYQSIFFNDPNWSPANGECDDGAFKLFFEQPDSALPASATTWDGGTDWVNPPVVVPGATNLAFTPNSPDVYSGTLTFDLFNFPGGNVKVEVDTDNDGSFVGPQDRMITVGGSDAAPVELAFDGLDGLGAPIPPTQAIQFRVLIDQIAEIHFVNYDVESRAGIEVTQLTSDPMLATPAGDKTISWNDSHLDPNTDDALAPAPGFLTWFHTTWPDCFLPGPVKDGCASPAFQGADVNSAGGVHGWEWSPQGGAGLAIGWGNNRYIDDWKSAEIAPQRSPELVVDGREGSFEIAKSSVPDDGATVEPGDTVTYNVTLTNTSAGAVPITVANATIEDDLSAVLDDATLTGTPSATAGAVSVVGDTLTWTGNISPGTPVTISYQVTVNAPDALGDLVLENVVTSADESAVNCPPADPGPECSTVHPVVVVEDAVTPPPPAEPEPEVAGTTETASGSLPFTGSNLSMLLVITLTMLGSGIVLYGASRLRRRPIG